MSDFHQAMAHGKFEEVFPEVFFVTGTMRNEFFGSMWQFSRNMTVVREGEDLTLINTVRLDDEGLAALDDLGKVAHIVRLGDMHGIDDPFYVDRYKDATFWALPGMGMEDGLTVQKELTEDGELPFGDSSLFVFKTTQRPESILRINREGGIMIACDALQNWVEPDEFFDDQTKATMTEMGFFTPANLGPAWVMGSQPQAGDFARLKEVPFKHALCGHGTPLRENAQEAFHGTFKRMFGV